MRVKIAAVTFFLLIASIVTAQVPGYNSFDNINPGGDASVVNCFLQDGQGLVWLGTGAGLCNYDGYHVEECYSAGGNTSTRIYCALLYDDRRTLFAGGDNGVHIYDTYTDSYIDKGLRFPGDVRALLCRDGIVWIGTLNGFYSYDPALNGLIREADGQLPHPAIYSLAGMGGHIYIGTYNGLARFDPATGTAANIDLPVQAARSNRFVNSLLADPAGEYLWVGTEGGLFRYYPSSGRIDEIHDLDDNSVKSLAVDTGGNLIAGTDDGVYVYNAASGRSSHLVHDSRNDRSLANNIVWGVYCDGGGNLWLGTDNGISLAPNSEMSRFVPISDITGIGDGNQFHTILRDSRRNLWLGGTNGLIRTQGDLLSGAARSVWYRMGDERYPISHNRIRDITEDADGNLWVATDGSVNRYNYGRGQFDRFNITDTTGTRNANWAYNVFDDGTGGLWVSAYLGGLFRTDKRELIASRGRGYTALRNWSSHDGLAGDAVNNMAMDCEGWVWTQSYPAGINRVNSRTGEVSAVIVEGGNGEVQPNYLTKDKNGNIWTGKAGWVTKIDPKTGRQQPVQLDAEDRGGVVAMDDGPGYMWVASSGGIYAIDKESLRVHHAQTANRNYTAVYCDTLQWMVYIGTTDGVLLLSPETAFRKPEPGPIVLTSMQVNNRPFKAAGSVRYTAGIILPHDHNNLVFTVSDFNYSAEHRSRFVYRLDGLDNQWMPISDNGNRISYHNLAPGNYTLLVSALGPDNMPLENTYSLPLQIRSPWYWTVPARTLYVLLVLGIMALLMNSYRIRHNLRMERMRKEQSLELSNLKMEFFTNISHEFKTPLSLILAPLSKLLTEKHGDETHRQLELIQRNAMKLNSLTHQVLEFNRDDPDRVEGVILSRVEFIGFARSIFSTHAEGAAGSGLSFSFASPYEKLYAEIDLLKTESILNNLISNAVKYTPEGGSVALEVRPSEDGGELLVTVSDTGVGIPEAEVPYVFGRFFQSSRTRGMNKGTGVGLYIVRRYTELQGGRVLVASQEGAGTQITVALPLRTDETPVLSHSSDSSDDAVPEGAPLVLVVEDNPGISAFVAGLCKGKYRCEIAENGRAGLEKCMELHPDIIVSDIMMPVMDGLEMCRRIRANAAFQTVPIMLLTAKDDIGTQLESSRLAIDAFFPKPFDPELLISRIGQLVQLRRKVESQVRIEAIADPKPIEALSQDEKFLARITAIIEDNVDDPDLNVNALSEKTGIGAKQIYRKVKQLTGTTPVDYIRTIRLKKAAMLLDRQTFTVSEVMYMVGFSNSSYFSKCFHQEFGKTPSQYAADSGAKE